MGKNILEKQTSKLFFKKMKSRKAKSVEGLDHYACCWPPRATAWAPVRSIKAFLKLF